MKQAIPTAPCGSNNAGTGEQNPTPALLIVIILFSNHSMTDCHPCKPEFTHCSKKSTLSTNTISGYFFFLYTTLQLFHKNIVQGFLMYNEFAYNITKESDPVRQRL